MAYHRPTRDGMQHLRQIGLHPRALAGGKDDGGGGGIAHDRFSLTPDFPTESGGKLPQWPAVSKLAD
jgi:hypothetical protein